MRSRICDKIARKQEGGDLFRRDMKQCLRCRLEKEDIEFLKQPLRGPFLEYESICLTCIREEITTQKIGEMDRICEKEKSNRYKRYVHSRYKLTEDDYDKMFEAQQGSCKICGKKSKAERWLHIDHNHATGKVRGLLCPNCNHAIGLLQDNVEIAGNLMLYLIQNDI